MRRSYQVAHGLNEVKFVRQFARAPSDLGVAGGLVGGNVVRVGVSRSDSHTHRADERVRVNDLKMAAKQIIHYLSGASLD
jgi:hypothetical protein